MLFWLVLRAPGYGSESASYLPTLSEVHIHPYLLLTDDVDPERLAELWTRGELALEVALVLRLHEPHLQRPVPREEGAPPPLVVVNAPVTVVVVESVSVISAPEELEAAVVDEPDVADVQNVRVLAPHPRHLQ